MRARARCVPVFCLTLLTCPFVATAARGQTPPRSNDLFVASFATGHLTRIDGSSGTTVYDFPEDSHTIAVAKGPDGRLYVSNGRSSVIRVDLQTGDPLRDFATGGGLLFATGVAFGPDGNLYVGDRPSNSVKRYNGSTGAFIDTFIPSGSGGLALTESVLFGPDRNLYVTELNGNRVLRYNRSTGAFLGVFATAPSLDGARSMAFGPDGNLYVAGNSSGTVVRFNSRTGAFKDVFASGINGPNGLAFGPDGNLYVAAEFGNTISQFDPRTGAFLGDFCSVTGPIGIFFDVPPPITNDLFAASLSGHVVRFDGLTGATVYDVAERSVAIDLAKGPDGALYVSTAGPDVVRVDLPSGTSSGVFATGGGLAGSFGVAFGPDGNLYIGDQNTSSVLRYNGSTGAFIDTFVPHGSGGLFPTEALLFGPDGNLYVTESSGNRVLRYDGTTGAFVDVFATDPSLAGARSMTFGPDGNLYVAGNFSNNVVRFDGMSGAFIDVFATGISGPNGLVFGPDGNLYVAAQFADKISQFDGATGAFLGDFASVPSPIGLLFDLQ